METFLYDNESNTTYTKQTNISKDNSPTRESIVQIHANVMIVRCTWYIQPTRASHACDK